MADNEYEYYNATIRVPKGTRISRSRKTDGAHAGNVHDRETKKLRSADIFLKDDADSPTSLLPVFDYGRDEYALYPRAENPPGMGEATRWTRYFWCRQGCGGERATPQASVERAGDSGHEIGMEESCHNR
ncbi:hypothetical protein [Phytohabitans suffuscus]